VKNVETINTNVDPIFIEHTKFLLSTVHGWVLASTEHKSVEEGFSDTGLLLKTYSDSEQLVSNEVYPILNTFAEYLLKTSLFSSNKFFDNLQIKRIFWNYYNHASQGNYHIDNDRDSLSLIFNFSNSGGTQIANETFKSKAGTALLFPSMTEHRGLGPNVGEKRFCLNVIFEGVAA